MVLGSAAAAAPFVMKMAGMVPDAEGLRNRLRSSIHILSVPDVWVAITVSMNVPHGAIQQGDDTYVIDQKKCLHCGTCYKVCNAGIVTRK